MDLATVTSPQEMKNRGVVKGRMKDIIEHIRVEASRRNRLLKAWPRWLSQWFLASSLSILSVKAGVPERTFKLTAESPKFWKLFDHEAKPSQVATNFRFTEGPVWDESGFIYVSDEVQNKIYRVFLDGRKEELISLGDPDGNTYDQQHRLIDCASVLRAIIAITPDGKYTVLADHFEGKKLNSPNDVVIGPDGAIYFTDPTLDLVEGRNRKFLSRVSIAWTKRATFVS